MLSGAQALGTDQDGQQIMYLEAHAEHQSNDPIEDTHTVVCGDGFSYVGVYDGHGGAQTSRFLRERSWQVFSEQLKATKDPKVAFERAWKALDETYIQECLDNPRRAGLFAGSCAVAMYFDCAQQCIWVANLGDSRAVLGHVQEDGWVETVPLTTDHSASEGKERHRVLEEHPHDATCVKEEWDEFLEIYVHLVKNICMFTRSIGDAYMKKKEVAELYNPRMDASHKVLPLPADGREYISNMAEVTVRKLKAGDSFVIIACDGLWDELSNHEAVTRCASFLKLASPEERPQVAQHLIDYALEKAAERLQKQEPELGVKHRADLLKIPPGRDGRKYLHDDITVSVVIFGTDGSRFPTTATVNAGSMSSVGGTALKSKARGRWGEIKKSVDLIKMMNGKRNHSKWHSLIDDLKAL